jgi:hypothetical protein
MAVNGCIRKKGKKRVSGSRFELDVGGSQLGQGPLSMVVALWSLKNLDTYNYF